MRHEKPTQGNPLSLTIRQHYITRHAIQKFQNPDGLVEVYQIKHDKKDLLAPDCELFCTMRTWDERSERGYMHSIEEDFHEEIDNLKDYAKRNHRAISRYAALWRSRFNHIQTSTRFGTQLNDISPDNLTKLQEETIESKHGAFIQPNSGIPERFIIGLQIQREIDVADSQLSNIRWGLITSNVGEFVVADNYGDLLYLPISPTLAFSANSDDLDIHEDQLLKLNEESISRAKNLYFAKSLGDCPCKASKLLSL